MTMDELPSGRGRSRTGRLLSETVFSAVQNCLSRILLSGAMAGQITQYLRINARSYAIDTTDAGISTWLPGMDWDNFGTDTCLIFILMPVRARVRKRIWRSVIILLLTVPVLAGAALLFLQYRFSQSLRYLVAKQSNGRFVLETGAASLSISEGEIRIRDARLRCRDTSGASLRVNARIPELYFSLGSWKSLLFKRKIVVDSISILRPVVEIIPSRGKQRSSASRLAIRDIFSFLDSTLLQLQLRSFALDDGEFFLRGANGGDIFHGEHIDLAIHDFTSLKGTPGNGLGTSWIVVSLGRQHWASPGGQQSLDFRRLHFDSHTRLFQLDSFSYSRKDSVHGLFRLGIQQLYCNSHHLADSFWRGKLLLDTLTCVHPVILQPLNAGSPHPEGKAAPPERGSAPPERGAAPPERGLFNPVSAGLVKVVGGRMALRDEEGRHQPSVYTQAVDLQMHGFRFDRYQAFPLSADSIRMDLKDLAFLTKDSGYKLSVGEIGIHGTDMLLRQVEYKPVRSAARRGVFKAPELVLRDIDIGQLLRKRLRAAGAELAMPEIDMVDPAPLAVASGSPGRASSGKDVALLVRTLHNIRELIDAPVFRISNGTMHYVRSGGASVDASISGLNASVLLNRLFKSDNLMDIKRAITDWRIDSFRIITATGNLSVGKYRLVGDQLYSRVGSFRLLAGNGWQVRGEDVFYSGLDWDLFQTAGIIGLDSLHVGRLTLRNEGDAPAAASKAAAKAPLPNLHIRTLSIDSLSFNKTLPGESLRCAVTNLRVSGLQPLDDALEWEQASAAIRDLRLRTDKMEVAFDRGDLDSEKGLRVSNTRIVYGPGPLLVQVGVPLVAVNAGIHSTREAGMHGISLRIPDASFQVSLANAKDTIRSSGRLRLLADSIRISPRLSARTELVVHDARAEYRRGTTGVRIDRLSMEYKDSAMTTKTFDVPDWTTWLRRVAVSAGGIRLSTSKVMADVASLDWMPAQRALLLHDFAVSPLSGRDEFFRQSQWQNDFIAVSGERLGLRGISLTGDSRHPAVGIREMTLAGVTVEASRDKHMPFHHGVEKTMPTRLISALPLDVVIDTTRIDGCHVHYNELSAITNKWSHISLDGLTGSVVHIRSRNNVRDSLVLDASSGFLGGHIRRFIYKESYGDPLSGFVARANFAPFDLTRLSRISAPAAAVNIMRGRMDTAWSTWMGNANAAYGQMDLHYRDLRVRILNRQDSVHRGFVPALETFAANLILRSGGKQRSVIFYQRDKEKFVFNYWVRTQSSGVVSALIHERSSFYNKQYSERHQQYALPDKPVLAP